MKNKKVIPGQLRVLAGAKTSGGIGKEGEWIFPKMEKSQRLSQKKGIFTGLVPVFP